ncbi:hypothetical protein A3K29_04690 [Candidatus Collierbacteria bacterium RIFOXYB2_FULL_46_14]|uniref:Diguanylate cyclase/phosphodiesterase with PAS/PAC sensor(S) n=1 Tax=Candidatus Collierbacteria bacterium GW2011_GWA2_46_26 TaxID=1618381 RepID=A0A0G1PK78_9BACT|nr:MAG: Diguanylate cyclase/phosphodiesterase with PAS/PAC sensor(S) [Candidatus Collierbacteria bacterium GW2011_GWC2_44_13]KKU33126.1 MAG: Diguanylate cyclase/phosphodiesterase with PAS/PAC sensor(S) [Candidatus Collierbacteria bacterium GW2011_GWA2_46_26]OGD73396.1 MAG: hypothetical protein A3K29_04690 [Candidatus Collierbacteria bacterium RIFOXYB2_FULL_46_14]OGD76438.1 MAG: hypothetical protein A3K43_04690 [Candidatus Collierbacteria bacterium RIFOXYA2_FULL_46_20]OGD77774.1 MAG: hypothetica
MKDDLVSDIDPFGDEMSRSGDGVMLTDNQGKVLMINEIAKKMWLLPERVLKTRNFGAIMKYTAKLLRNSEIFLSVGKKLTKASNKVVRDEVYLKDGRSFDLHTFPMIGADCLVYGRIWYTRDVTEKKKAEDLQQLHSMLLENLGEGVVVTKMDRSIVYANRRFEEIFGYDKNELLGREISILNNPALGHTQAETSQMIIKEIEKNGRWTGLVENIRKDGTQILTDATAVKSFNSEYGDVCVTIQSDVTGERRATRRLVESEQRHRLFLKIVWRQSYL